MRTKERLATVLRGEGLTRMAALADFGRYDDYESDSATPMTDLVRDLRLAGRIDLALRAIGGEWDASSEEAREWFEREGRELLNKERRAELG